VEIGGEIGLRFEFAFGIADKHPADRHPAVTPPRYQIAVPLVI
jgi:hypothetical protein